VITGFNHTSFTVSNLERSMDFYISMYGLELISLADRPMEYVEKVTKVKSRMRVAYLRGAGITLELIEYLGSMKREMKSSVDNIGCGHICFNVDDLNKVISVLQQKGVRFLGELVTVPVGANKGSLIIYALDPDGIVTELIQPSK